MTRRQPAEYRLRYQWRFAPQAHSKPAANASPGTSLPPLTRSTTYLLLTQLAFYDCQFFPWDPEHAQPVFAAVGDRYVILARVSKVSGIQLLRCMSDGDILCRSPLDCLAWSRHPVTKRPRLAVAGEAPQIKLLDLHTGTVDRVLTGHGAQIDCIRASPAQCTLLASASGDHTMRVWDLDPAFEKQPCSVILEAEGARSGIQTLAWHRSGRFLLSGSNDTRLSLWTLPKLPDNRSSTDQPHLLRYPHFSSIEIHTDCVDAVQFHGDLILSKAAAEGEKRILLWRIVGFDPDKNGIPSRDSAPTDTSLETRTSFTHLARPAFEILLSFDLQHAPFSWMHFSTSSPSASGDVLLAAGNSGITEKGRSSGTWPDLSIWNLGEISRLKYPELNAPHRHLKKGSSAATGDRSQLLRRDAHPPSPDDAGTAVFAPNERASWGPFYRHSPHHRLAISNGDFVPRKTAFSTNGQWCIMVGTAGLIYAFEMVDAGS